MNIEIVNPDKTVFEGEAKAVLLPGMDGFFEILDNHAPLISVLKKGKIKVIDNKGAENFYEVNGGVVENLNNKVLILVD
jgi:F-type H+-transporting ATPase subunit epsilon